MSLDDVERAAAQARENAAWWARLSPDDPERRRVLIDSLVETYPFEIGNAGEGIPPEVRDRANRRFLENARAPRR